MALPELEQSRTILQKASNVLLIVPDKASIDAVASMIALYLTLEPKKSGRIDEVSPSHVPISLQFLPGSSQVKMKPEVRPDVIVDIAGPQAAGSIRQEPLTGGLRLHITFPEGATITKDQIETSVRALPYDAAVTFGASDLEALGSIFAAHTDFFYNTPIINIDNRADNEHFGTVNMVDITASSVAEVTHELITYLQPTLDPSLATALYAGIVAGTESFQKPSTTPRSFKVAAELMDAKADREAVIRYLVKTKPLSLLKIVGRIYARLRHDEHARLFWSILRPVDFQESGAHIDDVPLALKELTNNISDYNVIAILQETAEHAYHAYILLGKGLKKRRAEIQEKLKATRDNGLLRLELDTSVLPDAEKIMLEKIRSILP